MENCYKNPILGLINHILAFPVEEIDMMKEIFEYDKRLFYTFLTSISFFSKTCPIQPTLKTIKLRCKFEEYDKLENYLLQIKNYAPNFKFLFWNAEFSPISKTVCNLSGRIKIVLYLLDRSILPC